MVWQKEIARSSAGPRALEPKHRTLATPSARPGRVQTPWTSSNTAAPANTIADVDCSARCLPESCAKKIRLG